VRPCTRDERFDRCGAARRSAMRARSGNVKNGGAPLLRDGDKASGAQQETPPRLRDPGAHRGLRDEVGHNVAQAQHAIAALLCESHLSVSEARVSWPSWDAAGTRDRRSPG
jgi:hypothetical protein